MQIKLLFYFLSMVKIQTYDTLEMQNFTGFQLPFNTLEIYLAPVVAFVVHHNI